MTEDNCPTVSSTATKQRKKRKWDQPAELLVSAGVAVPGILPLANMGIVAGITLPGVAAIPGTSFVNHSTATGATLTPLLKVPLQQHGVAVAQKVNQIQDELIAREIVINDADSAIRYKLTKRQTQEEIQKATGAIVITRGKYKPPNAPPDGEKPLYLHISAGAHLETTAERIKAVDCAAAMVDEMLKHGCLIDGVKVNHSLNTCVFLGFEAEPSFNIAARIRGPNDQYVNHIMNETGATVLLKGCGSGISETIADDEGLQPLHLFLSSNNPKSLERAKLLAENLLDTISAECGASRVSSSKVYGAVPPPPQLLAGVQSFGGEPKQSSFPATSLTASTLGQIPSADSSVKVTVVSSVASEGIVSHAGWSNSGQSQANSDCNSLSSLNRGTSYIGYGGIYPQATPLQQVALALRQSTLPVTATVAPSTTSGCSSLSTSTGSSLEKDKRSSQKRKFQELPAATKGPANPNQGTELAKACDLTSDVGARDVLTISASKKLIEPSTNGLLPPPPRTMPPPPLPPKFTSSTPSMPGSKSLLTESSSNGLPDTLIKLMEYGDGDDDDELEETAVEPFKRSSNTPAAPKPFWAV